MKALKQLVCSMLTHEHNWKLHLLQNWPDIIGGLHDKVSLEKIDGTCLVLSVTDSCWLHELHLMKTIIIESINQKLDEPHIKTIRLKQRGRPRQASRPKRKKQAPLQRQTSLTTRESTALKTLSDPALKQAMEQFLHRCKQEQVDEESKKNKRTYY